MGDDFASILFRNIITMYIKPEIERRKKRGTIDQDFNFYAGLVLFSLQEKEPIIQLNEEVEAQAWGKTSSEKKIGEIVNLNEIQEIQEIILPEKYKDSGFIFVFKCIEGYSIHFDFVYNKSIRDVLVKRATEYIETARLALKKKYQSVFIDTLFSAGELLSRAYLIQRPDKKILHKTSHDSILEKINRAIKNDESVDRFSRSFNKLSGLRHNARYGNQKFSINESEAKEYLSGIMDFMKENFRA